MSTPTIVKFQTSVPSTSGTCGMEEIYTQLATMIEVPDGGVKTNPGNAPLPKDPPTANPEIN